MSDNLEYLLAFLNQQADLNDRINKKFINPCRNNQRLILENGQSFLKKIKPTPFRGEPKSCYQTCFQALWNYPELSYCEGFAISNEVPIPIANAWLVDDNSHIIDPTGNEDFTGCTYFGVVFTEKFVREVALKTKYYRILENDYLDKYQILQDGFYNGSLHPRFHPNL